MRLPDDLCTLMKRVRREDSGQTLVISALCMTVLLCFLGLSIDMAHLRLQKRRLQTAADAAAVAAGLELRVCGVLPNCPAMQAAAQAALTENGYTSAVLATNCLPILGSSILTLGLNDPPCSLGSADPNQGSTRFVEVVLTEKETTYFARLLNFNGITLSARAEARRNPGTPCIYALDPTGAKAINFTGAVASTIPCPIVDESTSANALYCTVAVLNSIPSARVTGGTGGLLCLLNSTNITTNAPRPTPNDPLAYLPTPTVGSCGSSTASPYTGSSKQVSMTLGGTYVFNPGVYCGGISFSATVAANVTFNPGTYILKQGPSALVPTVTTGGLNLAVSALSTMTGNGVTFYNLGPTGAFSITANPVALSLTNFNLNAPASGTYGGILLFQDPSNTTAGTLTANLAQGNSMNGAVYLPQATVTYGIGAVSSAYTILVAKDINFGVTVLNSSGNNYSSLTIGSPLNGDSAILAQ